MVTFIRIIKTGFKNFRRNGWLSTATIGIMTMALCVFTGLLMIGVLTSSIFAVLQDKIDISVYFNLNAEEDEILGIKKDLEKLPEVKAVAYVSREEALLKFKEKHRDNPIIMQSLEEVGQNPLPASLNIKSFQASQYEAIASWLDREKLKPVVEKVNFYQNEAVIARFNQIISIARQSVLVFGLILAFLAMAVTFNTIRLAIYSSREEINVMRLVGGSSWFIKGPFLFEGMIYGFLGSLLAVAIFYPILGFVSPAISTWLPGADLAKYFAANFWTIFLMQTGIGVALGMFSSGIATRRYLKV
ncbi:MAG: permease-like cell division protein FtsX [bacterium]|nr:permease-like cell division protein FtsX [bacterium]